MNIAVDSPKTKPIRKQSPERDNDKIVSNTSFRSDNVNRVWAKNLAATALIIEIKNVTAPQLNTVTANIECLKYITEKSRSVVKNPNDTR